MNTRLVLRYIGFILLLEAACMLPALLISIGYGEPDSVRGFSIAICLAFALGIALTRIRSSDVMRAREGLITVALGWIVLSLVGGLPFLFSGTIPSFVDCFFETVSGFTTTGASIMTSVEDKARGILYWRSFTHWLGGMGVLVFLLAIVPLTRGNGGPFQLMRAESPGPDVGKVTSKVSSTSRALYAIYFVMTVIEIILLRLGGMPLFEAVTHSFGTAGTGGFSVRNLSIGAYDSTYIHLVIGIFMALFGVNFSVYNLMLTHRLREALHDEEFRLYWAIILGATVVIGFNILPMYANAGTAFRDSFFQVSSIMTTTGYSTTDFNLWPELSRYLLVVLMIIGASAGSTGGGIKVIRLLLLFKHTRNEVNSVVRPRQVRTIRVNGRRIDDGIMRGTTAFFFAYCVICALSMAIVALDNFDFETTVTAVFACINNIGPGLGVVGPMGNFSTLSDLSKIVLSFDMLLGRLEIFPILLLFIPSSWKRTA